MSVCGSTVTSLSTASADGDGTYRPSALEICADARRRLGLDRFKVAKNDDGSGYLKKPHLLVCSKELLEKYVIPLDADGRSPESDGLLRNIRRYHAENRTSSAFNAYDFNCAARNVRPDRLRVTVDLDCLVCKRGNAASQRPAANRHFHTEKALEAVLAALRVLYADDASCREDVYMTRGSTCGMHLFFGRLRYTDALDGAGVAREINTCLAKAGLIEKVAADEGCRMLPCPGANHSKSTYTRVYKIRFQGEHRKPVRVSFKLNAATVEDLENLFVVGRVAAAAAVGETHVDPPKRARSVVEVPTADVECSPPKRARSVVGQSTPVVATDAEGRPTAADVECGPPERARSVVGQSTSVVATDAEGRPTAADVECGPPERAGPVVELPRRSDVATEAEERRTPVDASDDDAASTVVESVGTYRGDDSASSVASRQRPSTPHKEREARRLMPPPPPLLLPVENDEYTDGEFPDKQYKTDLVRAENRDALSSASSLQLSRNLDRHGSRQIYLENGSSLLSKRSYRLLIQLENVNRAVYKDDAVNNCGWRELKINYFNYYLINPVVLKILEDAIKFEPLTRVFGHGEYMRLCAAVQTVLRPFLKSDQEERGRAQPLPHVVLEENDEYDSAKDLIVSALVKVCTARFNMITAVLSDFKKVQEKKYKYELNMFNRTATSDGDGRRRGRPPCAGPSSPADEHTGRAFTADDGGDDDPLDCSASTAGEPCRRRVRDTGDDNNNKLYNNYAMLASLILHEEDNLRELSLYALLYYYHSFPNNALERLLNEIAHEALMVTAVIRFFLTYNRKMITLQEIFGTFADVMTQLCGGVTWSPKKSKAQSSKGRHVTGSNETTTADRQRNKHSPKMIKQKRRDDETDSGDEGPPADHSAVTDDRGERQRDMPLYKWNVRNLYEAMIDFYFRPVTMFEEKMVFAIQSYDVSEDDAVDSCHTHTKLPKADLQAAFRGGRKRWEMAHGSQLLYNSDLESPSLKCTFHVNIALKMYETLVGGCTTRMKRLNRHHRHDDSRFNFMVYDVVAECMTASSRLTAAIDRSYVNLLLRQPVVPPFLEDEPAVRRMFMSKEELSRGSFCCLSIMDYVRILDLYEKRDDTDSAATSAYVDAFLNTLVDDAAVSECPPPNAMSARNFKTVYVFFCTYLFEVAFALRHAYARKERRDVTVDRICHELDLQQLLLLFFGDDEMKRVAGLAPEVNRRVESYEGDKGIAAAAKNAAVADDDDAAGPHRRFDVRPVPSAEVPDKVKRMEILFGRFGFEVMNSGGGGGGGDGGGGGTDGGTRREEDADETAAYEESADFENKFYKNERWADTVLERAGQSRATTARRAAYTGGGLFSQETVAAHMKLELRKHLVHDRPGRVDEYVRSTRAAGLTALARSLSTRLKLLAAILATHAVKRRTARLAYDYVEFSYKAERRLGNDTEDAAPDETDVWYKSWDALLSDRRNMLEHCRWLASQKFPDNFFVGFNELQTGGQTRVYDTLYRYMTAERGRYPVFDAFRDDSRTRNAKTVERLCVAVMFLLVMSAYDQEQLRLYLKMFLAVEWPGQWAKTIFVWKSNSNAGKSYLFDSVIKKACGQSTCINDPKGGKENAPEKAEYVKNFVLFAHEFSQAHSNELKKIVSDSTIKFRLNYGNTMNEAYTTGKIMFNCNALPPTTDEAAINRLTLFNVPFWFCPRERVSDAMLNWVKTPNSDEVSTRWERAYRNALPGMLGEEEIRYFRDNPDTKNELDLFDENVAVTYKVNKTFSPMFLAQNRTSLLYVALAPPTDDIVPGIVNITRYFTWLRYFNKLDMPVDFTMLPASSEKVRHDWLSMTLPYHEWKKATGAKRDTTCRLYATKIFKSLKEFATKKNVNYEDMKQFFESDFADSKIDTTKYCVFMNSDVV